MVKLHLDKERTAKLTPKAIKAFEKRTGKSFTKLQAGTDFTIDDIVTLIWASLLDEDPDVTLELVETQLEFAEMQLAIKEFFGLNPTTPAG
jgi:hypothetical protein